MTEETEIKIANKLRDSIEFLTWIANEATADMLTENPLVAEKLDGLRGRLNLLFEIKNKAENCPKQ